MNLKSNSPVAQLLEVGTPPTSISDVAPRHKVEVQGTNTAFHSLAKDKHQV
jgi:hypothetical protein